MRKIADNVLYIMQAPELKLDSDQFMRIQAFEEADNWGTGRRRPNEQKDPPPEKYSLEWYMLEGERNRKARERAAAVEANEGQALVVAAATLVLGTAGILMLG